MIIIDGVVELTLASVQACELSLNPPTHSVLSNAAAGIRRTHRKKAFLHSVIARRCLRWGCWARARWGCGQIFASGHGAWHGGRIAIFFFDFCLVSAGVICRGI
jgi:hypothetical protein